MILSDKDIKSALKAGDISIDPFDEKYLQSASVDLHLDRHFLVYDTKQNLVIDPKLPMEDLMEEVLIDEDKPFVLQPGEFALGMIYEKTGVSSRMVGRLAGNSLKMTLELHNTANLPILLYYKMPIAQMAFEELSSPCERPYSKAIGSKYVGDMKPRPSQMWKNFKK